MNAIKNGARQAIFNCLKVQKGERMVIVTDRDREYMADEMANQAKEAGAEVQKFIMEDFGDRSEDGSNPLKFPDEIAGAMKNAQVSCYIAGKKVGELASFRQPLSKLADELKLRHAHMPNFTEEMMSQGMAADYDEIQKLSKKIYDLVSVAKEVRVTTPAGTDVIAKFDGSLDWQISDGMIKPGNWSNLPDGEVYGSPTDINGVVVVDGCFGDIRKADELDLREYPVKYELKGGRCVKESVECKDEELKKEFIEYTFNTDENLMRAGEFAIGTNIGLKELIGVLLQDEKFPGIHIALGNPYPDKTGAKWSSKAHNDGVMRNTTIWVDGKMIMKDGKFII